MAHEAPEQEQAVEGGKPNHWHYEERCKPQGFVKMLRNCRVKMQVSELAVFLINIDQSDGS